LETGGREEVGLEMNRSRKDWRSVIAGNWESSPFGSDGMKENGNRNNGPGRKRKEKRKKSGGVLGEKEDSIFTSWLGEI